MLIHPLYIPRRTVPNLVMAQRVLNKMAKAASHYLRDETGEAMVGLLIPGAHTNGVPTLYVLDTIAPDESAVREWATFQQGDDRQDELIWWLQENWRVNREKKRDGMGGQLAAKWDVPLRYLGDWHKQPGLMIQPSQGDLMTARQWINDPENGMDFLLAPIVTVGHPSTTASSGGGNYLTAPQGDGTSMRVDFWYIDQNMNDFMPISPTLYPDSQLPALTEYPWHLVNEERYRAEFELLEKDGLFTSVVLWDVDDTTPLDICVLTARVGAEKVVILVTPWNYPAAPPSARVAPHVTIQPDDDIYAVFESLWRESEPIPDPPGWQWSEGKRLADYLYAIEEKLGFKHPAAKSKGEPSQETRTAPEEQP
jgi:hypothetical protein